MNQHQHIMDDLLVKYLLGEASPGEIQTVQDWLSSDPENQNYFQQVRLIWERSLRLQNTPLRSIDDREDDEDKAWAQFRQRIHAPKSSAIPTWTRIAASFLLIASLTWWWSSHKSATVLIADNHTLTDTLPDGSIVLLNKHTQISHKDSRTVELKGEAFFNIAPDKTKPFTVRAGTATITVLGTSFNIQMQADTTTITVETGQIKISTKNQNVLLSAGEEIAIYNDTIQTKQPIAKNLYNYYHPREFDCNDTPLKDLVQALNTAYDVHIEIANPALQNLKITTTFKDESLDQILSVLKSTFSLTIGKKDNQILLH
ncbi:MAG: FecR domain-containing protein [Bacteroidetes bacterium]|nr:FecR domain-containing protein [Bacteroidota bacterium]